MKQKGIGLFELMIALAIVAAIIAGSLLQYRHQQWKKDIAILQNSEAMLQQATIMYWFQNCQTLKAQPLPISIAFLKILEMLPKREWPTIQNPWVNKGTQQFQIDLTTVTDEVNGDKRRYIFEISTTIDKPHKAVVAIANNLGAIAKGNAIKWVFTPRQLPKKLSSNIETIATTYGSLTAFSNQDETNESSTIDSCPIYAEDHQP